MIRRLDLPDTASLADGAEDARLSAPSALRNAEAILAGVLRVAPATGRALEIASGSGEHVIRFAAAMPGVIWQPTDPDPTRRASIAAWADAQPAPNLLPPLDLDAGQAGWGDDLGPVDLVVLVNLLHLISEAEMATLLAEAARALTPGGAFVIYGPFLRDGQATSEGDASFHASLQAQDRAIGYKDVADVLARAEGASLEPAPPRPMPANNLLLVLRRPAALT